MFAFKKFSFFQQVEVKLHGFPPNSTCHCEGPQQMFVGCDNGSIHVLDETYQSQGSFGAFGHKVLYMAYVQVRARGPLPDQPPSILECCNPLPENITCFITVSDA